MRGLAKICKAYGSMKINGINFVWDYVADTAVLESEMPKGSQRWKESERVKWSAAFGTVEKLVDKEQDTG